MNEGFQPQQAMPLFDECRTVRYAADDDRSMIGTVNELVKEVQFWLPRHGGVLSPDLLELHRKLNRSPLKRNQYEPAIDRAMRLFEGQVSQ